MKLERRYVEKPWGRTQLPAIFDAPPSKRIGEVWFTCAGDQPLLVKYLFTPRPAIAFWSRRAAISERTGDADRRYVVASIASAIAPSGPASRRSKGGTT
jgi:mannose-6-phosphate isomerase class I